MKKVVQYHYRNQPVTWAESDSSYLIHAIRTDDNRVIGDSVLGVCGNRFRIGSIEIRRFTGTPLVKDQLMLCVKCSEVVVKSSK